MVLCGAEIDFTSVFSQNFLADIQPETGASLYPGGTGIALEEFCEHAGPVIFRDHFPHVVYRNPALVILLFKRDGNGST